MKRVNNKVWLGVSIFCIVGTVVMLFSGEPVAASIAGSIFYLVIGLITGMIYKKNQKIAHQMLQHIKKLIPK